MGHDQENAANHAKAEWFADLWEHAVAGCDEKRINVCGVHSFIVMATDEETTLTIEQLPIDYDPGELEQFEGSVMPPTNCSWSVYENMDKCYNNQLVVTHYGEHRREADTEDVPTPTGVSLPQLPRAGVRGELEFDESEDFADYLVNALLDDLADQLEFDSTH
ncbi:hypothetical protein GS429_17480 [Natronorubrum sp. JWXQ-INN-674]|uniref:Uncharacterized protein n=1 Tax=Natronorubrum halalkaliphilum TaxID=2691917 RepID=A0A6B0VQA9_9EURY|nr:hypothetical protein [Natronorubrum halalkaliphilum]MXV63820.1 hypothetical protein [Natronorubrum halalkaliphilum]